MVANRKTWVLAALLAAVPALGAATPSQAVDSRSARARLAAFADGLHSVSASFSQTVTDANGRSKPTAHGTLALEAPRLFRWQVDKPYSQLIVADGSRVWIYEPDLEQVTVRAQGAEEAHSPLTVLTDLSLVDKDFAVGEGGTRDGLSWVELVPKAKDAQIDKAALGFDDEKLVAMTFADALGDTTTVRFSNWKRNPDLPASLFTFAPPAGVDVIGGAGTGAETFPLSKP